MRKTNTETNWISPALIGIKIKNYKRLDIEIDGTPNNNGIDADLDAGYFHKVDEQLISRYFSITGSNAFGKSSILEAINFTMTHMNLRNVPSDKLAQMAMDDEIVSYLEKVDKSSYMNGVAMPIDRHSKIISNANKISNLLSSNDEFIINYVSNKKQKFAIEWHDKYSFIKSKPIEISYKLYSYKLKQKFDIEFKISKNGTEVSSISQNLSLNIDDLSREANTFLHCIVPCNVDTNKSDDYFIDTFMKDSADFNDKNAVKHYFNILNVELGKNRLTEYLQIFDPNISGYNIGMDNKIRIDIFGKEDSIELHELSLGTRAMIFYLSHIIFTGKRGGLLLIDEIENHLNYKFVNMIKLLVKDSKNIQLLFTTHSSHAATKNISTKQIYLLKGKYIANEDLYVTTAKKASSIINANNSIQSVLEKGNGIDSPDESSIVNFVYQFINGDIKDEDII